MLLELDLKYLGHKLSLQNYLYLEMFDGGKIWWRFQTTLGRWQSFQTLLCDMLLWRLLKFFMLVLEDFRGDGSLWEIAVWKTSHAENTRWLDQN